MPKIHNQRHRVINSFNHLLLLYLVIFCNIIVKEKIKLSTNFAGFIKPKYLNFKKKISYTPKQNILSKKILISIGKPNQLISASSFLTFNRSIDYETLHNLSTSFLSIRTTWYTISNVYGNDHGSWAFGNSLVFLPFKSYYPGQYLPYHFNRNNGKMKYIVDEILLIGHKRCQNNYGHFLADKCVSLMLLPDDVKQRCYIIGNSYYPVVKEGLLALGFRENQILNFEWGDWFSAQNMHVFANYRPMTCMGGPYVVLVRQKFFEFYDLDSIPATRYAMVNRTSMSRNILNFNELFFLTQSIFSSYNWEKIPDYIGNLSETTKVWTSLRFVFVIVGSSATKGLFMKPNTVMCIPFCNDFLDYTLLNLLTNSKHAVRICNSGMKMFENGIFPINISESILSIKYCLYYDKYKRWPSSI